MEFLNKQALINALKELGRVVLIAVLPVLIIGVENGQLDFRTVLVVGAIAGLRFIDKLLHEVGKATEDDRLIKGLTRF